MQKTGESEKKYLCSIITAVLAAGLWTAQAGIGHAASTFRLSIDFRSWMLSMPENAKPGNIQIAAAENEDDNEELLRALS